MALAGGATATATGILCNSPHPRRPFFSPFSLSWSRHPRPSPFSVSATPKKLSRTGKFDNKNRRTSPVPTELEQQETKEGQGFSDIGLDDAEATTAVMDDGFVMPDLPGNKPDFWEGPQWDAFGFFIQYMWAFGIVFALVACGIAVATFNEGATDFKDTPVYKEAIQSQELLEEPDTSNSEVFESNPTEQAPSLE